MRVATLTTMLVLILKASSGAAAEVASDVRDAAARIDYGWYTGELGLIVAARDALGENSRDPWVPYVRAYASYRAALLRQNRGQSAATDLALCTAAATTAADAEETVSEAEVLLAACAALAAREAPLRAVLQQRRMRQALERARALDAANPRLALVNFLYAGEADGPPATTLDDVLAGYRARNDRQGYPDWGEAEALALLGTTRFESGDLRGARDLLEEAMTIAPDFTAVIALQRRLQGSTATNR